MYQDNYYSNWGLAFIFLILLGIFIIFVIIVASGYDHYKDYRKESCRQNLSELSGQLLRAIAGNTEQQDYFQSVYNTYVSAAGCSTNYNL